MPQDQLYDHFADLQKLNAEKEAVLKMMEEIKVKTVSLNTKISIIDGAASKRQVDEVAKATTVLEENTKIVQQRITQLNGQSKEFTQTLFLQSKASKESAQATLIQAKAADQLAKSKERASKESAKAAAKAAEEERPYKKLALAFAAASKNAQDLAAQYGRMDKRSQEAARTANKLNDELKNIDASIGNHQRNIGNYSSAFDKASLSIKNLATNFLSLIGIVGTGAILSSSVDEFIEMDKNVRILQNTLKNLGIPEAFGRIEIAANSLAEEFKFLDNDDILKTFNQLIVYGKLTEDQINQLVPVIINFATATGQDLASATSVITKALEGNSKSLREFGINMKDAKGPGESFSLLMRELAPRVDGVGKAFKESAAGGLAIAKQEFKDLKEEIGGGLLPALNGILSFLSKAGNGLKDFAKGFREVISGGSGFFNINKDALDNNTSQQSIIKQLVDQRVNTYKNIPKEIEKSLGRKLTNSTADQLLLSRNTNIFLATTQANMKAAQAEVERLRKDFKNTKEEGIALANALQTIGANQGFFDTINNKKITPLKPERIIDKSKKDDAKKEAEDAINLQKEIAETENISLEKRLNALTKYLRLRRDALLKSNLSDEELMLRQQQVANEGVKIFDAIASGVKLEFNESKPLVPDIVDVAALSAEAEKIGGDFSVSLIKGVVNKLQEAQSKEEAAKALKDLKEGMIAQIVGEGVGLGFDLIDAESVRKQNAIQDEIDMLEKKKQKELEIINQSLLSEQDKAAKVTILEARSAAEREQLEKRQRDLRLKQAKFDKAEAIANIIQQTAVSVLANSVKSPALIPFIIALGALQLARVASQPIPKFAKGTHSSPEGFAEVAEQGPELAIDSRGKAKIYDKRTLTYLSKGTKIFPANVTKDILNAAETERSSLMKSYNSNVSMSVPDNRDLLESTVRELRELNKKSRIIIHANTPVEVTAWYQKNMKY